MPIWQTRKSDTLVEPRCVLPIFQVSLFPCPYPHKEAQWLISWGMSSESFLCKFPKSPWLIFLASYLGQRAHSPSTIKGMETKAASCWILPSCATRLQLTRTGERGFWGDRCNKASLVTPSKAGKRAPWSPNSLILGCWHLCPQLLFPMFNIRVIENVSLNVLIKEYRKMFMHGYNNCHRLGCLEADAEMQFGVQDVF